MAQLRTPSSGSPLSFEINLLGWKAGEQDEQRWLEATVGIFIGAKSLAGYKNGYSCSLLVQDVRILCQELRELLEGKRTQVDCLPLDPFFRLLIEPSSASGLNRNAPWRATAMLDTSLLQGGPVTASGPAVVLILDDQGVHSFLEEMAGECRRLGVA